jgi:dienelactone hydrolase
MGLIAAIAAVLALGGIFLGVTRIPVRLPPPSGPYGVASRPLQLPSDQDSLATPIAEIWYPIDGDTGSAPRAGAPLPVLIYLPSWDGTEVEDMFLIRDLVSHGFAVAGLRYPTASEVAEGKDRGVVLRAEAPGEMDFSSQAAYDRTRALGDAKVRSRAGNVVEVLDRLARLNQDEGDGLAHRLDLDRIGVWGFSLGGAAAAQAAWQDRRIKAVVNLDGWLFGDVAVQGIPCPYLLIGDGVPLPSAADLTASDPKTRYPAIYDLEDYHRQIAGLTRHGGFVVTIDGTDHLNFSDAATRSRFRRLAGTGSIDPARALVITADYLGAFFSSSLSGQAASVPPSDPSGFPEVHVKAFGHSVAGF